MGGSY
jgi:hypothetical protein